MIVSLLVILVILVISYYIMRIHPKLDPPSATLSVADFPVIDQIRSHVSGNNLSALSLSHI